MMELEVEPDERQPKQLRREFSIPQITASQYEYRISRMPTRRRRRKDRPQEPHNVKSFSEPDPTTSLTNRHEATSNTPSESISGDATKEALRAADSHNPTSVNGFSQASPISSAYVEQVESPSAHQHDSSPPFNVDDQELLELGGQSNDAASQDSTWSNDQALQAIKTNSRQRAKGRKRNSELHGNGQKPKKTRTRAKRLARVPLPIENQLTMIHHDIDEDEGFQVVFIIA